MTVSRPKIKKRKLRLLLKLFKLSKKSP